MGKSHTHGLLLLLRAALRTFFCCQQKEGSNCRQFRQRVKVELVRRSAARQLLSDDASSGEFSHFERALENAHLTPCVCGSCCIWAGSTVADALASRRQGSWQHKLRAGASGELAGERFAPGRLIGNDVIDATKLGDRAEQIASCAVVACESETSEQRLCSGQVPNVPEACLADLYVSACHLRVAPNLRARATASPVPPFRLHPLLRIVLTICAHSSSSFNHPSCFSARRFFSHHASVTISGAIPFFDFAVLFIIVSASSSSLLLR
eukprot:615462-Pleurochrysis_carterae.AAC.2